jgi:hypothetical protein
MKVKKKHENRNECKYVQKTYLLIISYLDVQANFYGFTRLNNSFKRLFASDHLSFNIRLRKKKPKENLNKNSSPPWLNEILKHIIYLESTVEYGYEYIPEYLRNNIHKLIRTDIFQTTRFTQIHNINFPSNKILVV